jgi:beta-xylosidase
MVLAAVLLLPEHAGFSATNIGSWGDQGNGTYKNPVLNADYSDPDIIFAQDSNYYLVCSEFNYMGMPVLQSHDLVNWKIVCRIYNRLDLNIAYDTFGRYGRGAWAPSVRYHNGLYYVYFCTPDEGLCMSTAPSMLGPWSPILLVKSVAGWEDPCPFWDDDGTAYLGHSLEGAGPIIIHKMSVDGTTLLDTGVTVYSGTNAEGTKIYKRDGYYYLIIPEGGVTGGYETALRCSTSIYGPYVRKVVLQQGTTSINGPHQGGWVQLPSGECWFIHFQEIVGGALGRVCHLEPMKWVSDWPNMGTAIDSSDVAVGQPVSVYAKPDVGATFPIGAPQSSDNFSGAALSPQWEFNHNPVDSAWSVTARPGYYRILARKGADVKHAFNTITQKLMGDTGTATVELEIGNMASGQAAGLLHFGLYDYWIGVVKTGGVLKIQTSLNDTVTTGPTVTSLAKVWLRTVINVNTSTYFQYSTDSGTYTKLGANFFPKFGNWKGSKLGLFSYNTLGDSGTADFHWFTYSYDGPAGGGAFPTGTIPRQARGSPSPAGKNFLRQSGNSILYNLAESGPVRIEISTVNGRCIFTWKSAYLPSGPHALSLPKSWQASARPAAICIVTLITNNAPPRSQKALMRPF